MARSRSFVVVIALASFLALPTTPAISQVPPDPTGVLSSPNVSLLTTLPNPGVIGARFRGNYMYVTSVTGLVIYDVSAPAAPAEVGRLPLPHFENEDVDLNGDILLISNDAAESTGILYVIDISDPTAPAILSTFQMGGDPVSGGPGHTTSCILGCKFAWTTDGAGIRVIDLTDPANPVDKGKYDTPAGGDVATHDVQIDGNGLAWVVGFGGAAAYKVPASYDGSSLGKLVAQTDERGLSTYMSELGLGDGSNPNDYVLHNSHRRKNSSVLYITEEDYARPGCKGAGSFGTWKVPLNSKGLPSGGQVTIMDMWETELNAAGTASAAAMCSAHYFDVRGNLVAQGWYEQGVRFLDVSDSTKVRQIGYFSAPTALNWAAYFAPTDPTGEIVYSFDATHGIDVLSFNRPAQGKLSVPRDPCESNCQRFRPSTVKMPIRSEWFGTPTVGTPNGDFGYACRLNLSSAL